MKIEVVVASEKHLSYVTAINDAIDHAAKARGTGIARRTNEYIADKIRKWKGNYRSESRGVRGFLLY